MTLASGAHGTRHAQADLKSNYLVTCRCLQVSWFLLPLTDSIRDLALSFVYFLHYPPTRTHTFTPASLESLVPLVRALPFVTNPLFKFSEARSRPKYFRFPKVPARKFPVGQLTTVF